MSEAFLGLMIKVQLHSGLNLQGTVAHIDPATQQMTLKDVELTFPGQATHFTPVYGVYGNEIGDLQVCEKKPVPTVSKSCNAQRKKVKPQKKNNTPVKSLSSNTGRKQQQQQQRKENGWANQDVDGFREKEFDFQANLNMFDKKKVFAEIRELDDSTTDTLLVTLNRLPKEPRKNLLPTENVLESDSIGDESDTESRTTSDESVPVIRQSRQPLHIRTVASHIPCTPVSPLQTAHAEHECTITGPTAWQLVENGGRAIAMLMLQTLGKQPTPVIIVLAGDSKVGASALAATRHLLNRGFHVAVCLENDQPSCDVLATQLKMVECAGGKVIRKGELYHWTPDLVVDAMHQDQDVRDMVRWASQQSAPILSVDSPSSDEIRPRWTVCLGAPKSGCVSQDVTGELYLADTGIPKICWKLAGVKSYTPPWGADFLIALEYVT
ncbi:YjeF N-terminal domain-containing protein [Fennellomyces sp. T-0311]|nr:YjeF N-terminal domain-containing protein [Fennellomyces sp. T-0311]